MSLLDGFFARSIIAGIGVALVVGPLGCFVVWRRLGYFGETLSHSALLGVALALLFEVNITLAVFVVSLLISLMLIFLQKSQSLSSDAILGLLAHSSLAIGLLCLAFMTWVRVDLLGFLFGDILAVSKSDIAIIFGGGLIVLLVLAYIWRPLFAATLSWDIAEAEGQRPDRANLVFMILMATVIAISMKIIGVMLITALLIIPAATARRFAGGPEAMAILAALVGVVAVIGGLYASLAWDTPSGPSIVVAALVIFLISLLPFWRYVLGGRRAPETPKTELM